MIDIAVIKKCIIKNLGWFITGCVTICGFFSQLIIYWKLKSKFNYYGISDSVIRISESNYFFKSIIFLPILICLCFASFLLVNVFNDIKIYCKEKNDKKNYINFQKIKNFICLVVFVLFINNCVILLLISNIKLNAILINNFHLLIFEILIIITYFKVIIKEKENIKQIKTFKELLLYIPIISIYLILCFIYFIFSTSANIKNQKEYRITEQNVIIYEGNDYYIVLDCEVKDYELTIFKGTQQQIDSTNLRTELIIFDEVIIVDIKQNIENINFNK